MEFKNLLQQADYSLILPNDNILPLNLIQKKKKGLFSWFRTTEGSLINADLKDLFILKKRGAAIKLKENKLPEKLTGSDVVNGDGYFTSSILSKAKLKADAKLNKAKKVLFTFENAKEIVVNQIQLDEYLQFAELNSNSPTFSEAVKKGQIFVITSVLQSNKLKFTNADDFGFKGDLDANAVKEYLSAKAGASYSDSETYTISAKNDTFLTFAIKTVQILFDNNSFKIIPTSMNVRGTDNGSKSNIVLIDSELKFE